MTIEDFEKLGFVYDSQTQMFDFNKIQHLNVKNFDYTIPYPINAFDSVFYANYDNLKDFKNFPIKVNHLYINPIFKDLTKLPTQYVNNSLFIIGKKKVVLKSLKSNLKSVNHLNLTNIKTLENLSYLENIKINELTLQSLHNLKSLKGCSNISKLEIINCDILNLKGIFNINKLLISNCVNLTSLTGLPKTIKEIRILNCPNLPKIEQDFSVQIQINNKMEFDYHLSLLKFIVSAKRESEIYQVYWPDHFKNNMTELIKSVSGISKFHI